MPRKKKLITLSPERQLRKELALSDFEEYIKLVQPKRALANIHREVITWLTASNSKNHKLLLLPRDHMKSSIAALYVTWRLSREPTLRVLYISSTSNLATKQLKFMKDIFTSDVYRIYWPDMVNKDEAKREKWTEREISLDHPARKENYIRDPSIFTAGLTSNIVGMHCDLIILDDVVVETNAYTEENREKVRGQYSYLASIGGGISEELAVGTRYHPKDLYSNMMEMEVETHDELGNVIQRIPLFDVKEYPVENVGDGTGEFLWPRSQHTDGKWYGFDARILADKRSHYLNKIYFRAQYYNDPHDIDSSPIQRHVFQYYDRNYLAIKDGRWYFKGATLNVVAAVDFAYSLDKKSDASAIVVVGVDGNNNYYVLDIDRFKTQLPSEYFTHILKLHEKWGFRKIRAEVSAAQIVLVKDLKESYIRPLGLGLVVEEYRPTRWQGSKEERILATLEPKYSNRQMWHYQGGNCQLLEEELIFANPAHDDIKDALAAAVDFAIAPVNTFQMKKQSSPTPFQFHSKFGGVA